MPPSIDKENLVDSGYPNLVFYTGTEGASPFVSYDFNPSAIEQTINQVTDVVTKIENKDFERKAPRNPKHCVECDLKFMCDHKCK